MFISNRAGRGDRQRGMHSKKAAFNSAVSERRKLHPNTTIQDTKVPRLLFVEKFVQVKY